MNQLARQSEILQLIQSGKCSSVKELCASIYASPATIRRDLHELESKGLVRMLYGNVIPLAETPKDFPLSFRQNQAKIAKRKLAKYAASIIAPNTTVMLDSSSSTLYMADYISDKSGITVFTNCIKTAIKLCENGVTVYLIGGKVDNQNFVTDGAWTEDNVRSINVDYLFFSAKAMDENGQISGPSESGIEMRKHMIKHARKQYFICTAEKTGKKSTFRLCDACDITGVITDSDISAIPNINEIRVCE